MSLHQRFAVILGAALVAPLALGIAGTTAQPLPGGTLDPLTIPKYVTPLVIPPVMNNGGTADHYAIAVRQFQQQILPGGVWAALSPACAADPGCNLPPTTVWSYGPDADPTPAIAPDPASQFNYPAYTLDTTSNVPVSVRWINELVADPDGCRASANPATDAACHFIPHLLPIDQTLHWANPPATDCRQGDPNRTDCATSNPAPYTGPVPIVTHVHGAHVEGHSDGYPEAWWLPAANDIPAGYATHGSFFDDATGTNPGNLGYADFVYRNDQPAATIWYHDHSLGMTRSNVYAGPAGFWLVRGGAYDTVMDAKKGTPAVLPGPAPVAGDTVLELNAPSLVPGTTDKRSTIREIPLAIQDRSFNADGSLFYPDNRAFFEGLNQPPTAPYLDIPFVPDSDIAPIWNPEVFFNTMVVNGVTWPALEVAPARYRFRLLNGCNSRFLNLALVYPKVGDPKAKVKELPFIQIGAEQGFLPQAVEILTGFATPLPGDGSKPKPADRVPAADPQQALLMGLAERADVIVDFSHLPDGTRMRMINTAPDAPFGGFPDDPADPTTTGQVMEFVVSSALLQPSDSLITSPYRLVPVAEDAPGDSTVTRQVSLNEEESAVLCVEEVEEDEGPPSNIIVVPYSLPPDCLGGGEPFGPKEALLGQVDLTDPDAPAGIALKWTDTSGASTPLPVTMADGVTVKMVNVTENPTVGDTETWEIYNFTADAHPIHLHLVRFAVVNREEIGGAARPAEPWESGYKDSVIAYPGEITRVKAIFDLAGLYVWHCHIVEHEDNEMMRPYVVSPVAP